MQTTKDVKSYFDLLAKESSESIVSTLEECSKNRAGKAMVNIKKECYNFDAVAKGFFQQNPPSSVDSLLITSKAIYFIEFKGGLTDEQKREKVLPSLKIKASDSLLLMQNCIFPYCEDTGTPYSLRLIYVYDLGSEKPDDEYELEAKDLGSGKKTSDSRAENKLLNSLIRYGQEDCRNHAHPFYDQVQVLSNKEFQNLRWLQ